MFSLQYLSMREITYYDRTKIPRNIDHSLCCFDKILIEAIYSGHLECLKYIHKNIDYFDGHSDNCIIAAKYG